MRVYVASSWRNQHLDRAFEAIRNDGHEAYDFRHVDGAFKWQDVMPEYAHGDKVHNGVFRACLSHDVTRRGFQLDKGAIEWCEALVLVLPCGKSAHMEMGYAAGLGKPCVVYSPDGVMEPELMYLLGLEVVGRGRHGDPADNVVGSLGSMLEALRIMSGG